MDEIQQWWEVASIAQFCSLFRQAFNLLEFDIEELEEGILADGTPGGSEFLQDLIIHLLRGCSQRRAVNITNWHTFLIKYLHKTWVKRRGLSNPIQEGSSFSELSSRTKVEILYSLCLSRLDCDDAEQTMKRLDADCLRVQSLGSDDKGNVYWYFYGTRLYKEEPSEATKKAKDWKEEWKKEQERSAKPVKRKRGRPRKQKSVKSDGESEESEEYDVNKNGISKQAKSHWSVVCNTLSEWQQLAQNFENSRSACEKSLFRIITNDFLPVLQEMYEQKAKRIKKKMMEFTPRRSSSRLEVKKLHKDDEERLAAISAADEFEVYCERQNIADEDISSRRKREARNRARRLEERQQLLERSDNPVICNDPMQDNNESSINLETNESVISTLTLEKSDNQDFYLKVRQVITSVKLHKDAWPFINPVDESLAPGYYDIIENPMALSTIENKLQHGMFKDFYEVEKDFFRMVDNCKIYNGDKSAYTTMAHNIWHHFCKISAKFGFASILHLEIPPNAPQLPEMDRSITASSSGKADERTNDLADLKLKKKKRKRPPGMKAIEALAQASEQALKNATTGAVEPLVFQDQECVASNLQAFPDLKIHTIQSHPPSLIAKYVSSASCDSTGSDSFLYSSSSRSPESFHDNDAGESGLSSDHPLSILNLNSNKQFKTNPTLYNSQPIIVSLENLCSETDCAAPGDTNAVSCSTATTANNCVSSSVKHFGNNQNLFSGGTRQVLSNSGELPNETSDSYTLSKMPLFLSSMVKENRSEIGDKVCSEERLINGSNSPLNSPGNSNSLLAYGENMNSGLLSNVMPKSSAVLPSDQLTMHQPIQDSELNILTVDASILGINVYSDNFNRKLDRLSSNSSFSASGCDRKSNSPSPLSPDLIYNSALHSAEKSFQDVLLGVELPQDITKTVQDLNRLKQTNVANFENSAHSSLVSPGTSISPLINHASPLENNNGTENTNLSKMTEASVDSTNAFAPLFVSKSNASKNNSTSPNTISITHNSSQRSIAGVCKNSQVLSNTCGSSHSGFLVPPNEQFVSSPISYNPQSESLTNLPLQLPLFHRPSTVVPSTLPYALNSIDSNGPLPTNSLLNTSSCPVTLISTQPLLTASFPSQSSVTTDLPCVPCAQTLTSVCANSAAVHKVPSKYQALSMEHIKGNLPTITNVLKINSSSSKRSTPEAPTPTTLLPSPKRYQQDLSVTVPKEKTIDFLPSERNVTVNNPSITSSIPKPYIVPICSNNEFLKTTNTDSGAQLEGKSISENSRHSVVISHPQGKSTLINGLPIISYNAPGGNDNVKLCGPLVTDAASKNATMYNALFAQSVPSLTTPMQTVCNSNTLFTGVNNNLFASFNNKSQAVNNNGLNNSVPITQNGLISLPNHNDQQYTIVSSIKNSIPSHVAIPASSHSLLQPNANFVKQSTKVPSIIPQNSMSGARVQRIVIPGIHQRLPHIINNTSSIPPGTPQYVNVPHYILPQQTTTHDVIAPNLLTHSNQGHHLSQSFSFVNTHLPFVDENNRQSIPGSRTLQFLAAATTTAT